MELFEFKFYKSYAGTFDNLSDEDAGLLIKRMYSFYFTQKDIKSKSQLVEAVFAQIKYTMEKSIQGKHTWGKRKNKPSTTPSRVPSTTPSTKDKVKDKVKDNIYIFSKENYKTNNTAYLLKAFYVLWYIPSQTETVETFRLWFKEKILDKHYFKTSSEINWIIDNFESYWSEQDKKVKNFKTTFINNPLLKNYAK